MGEADKKIANFLKAASELEQYLHEDRPLTPLGLQTIETTIMGLQTLLQSWMAKHSTEGASPTPITLWKAKES